MGAKVQKQLNLTDDPMSLFTLNEAGVYLTDPKKAPFAEVQRRVELMLSDSEIREDVISTVKGVELRANVPAGNTAVVDAGWELYGPRPYRIWKGERRSGFMHPPTEKEKRQLRNRQKKIYSNTQRLLELHESTSNLVSNITDEIAFKINSHQIKTGHAFDNTNMGDVTRAAMSTIADSLEAVHEFEHKYDKYFVMACDRLYDSLVRQGMRPGSLRVSDAMFVRCVANNDGLIPIWSHEHGLDPYTEEDDRRLLRLSGGRFSAKGKIGTQITYQYTHRGKTYTWQGEYPYIKALEEYILTQGLSLAQLIPVITTLERLQKSGVKDGQPSESYLSSYSFHQGDGKARSVSPLEDVPGLIEAMTIHAFNEKCKELKIDHFPSVQNPEGRKTMMASFAAWFAGNPAFRAVDLDLSKYDKRFIMDYLITIVQRVIKPFYHVDDWIWLDAICVTLAYKVMMIYTPYLKYAKDLAEKATKYGATSFEYEDLTFYPLWAALMSGLRGTHIAYGSTYNLTAVQDTPLLVIAERYGRLEQVLANGLKGMAAGDDVLAVTLQEFVQPGDPEVVLKELIEVIRDACGQEINPKKLIWMFITDPSTGKQVKILTYLQESHVFELNVLQITSEARAAAGYWIAEDQDFRRNPCLEAIGVLSKAQNGYSDPLRVPYLEYMLDTSDMLWYAFSEYGTNAWSFLVEGTKLTMDEIVKRLGIGDFYWGASVEDFKDGRLSILEDVIVACNNLKAAGKEPVASSKISQLLERRQDSTLLEENQYSRSDFALSEFE